MTKSQVGKWIAGVAASIAAGLVLWLLTSPCPTDVYRQLAADLRALENRLEGFVARELSPDTIQGAFTVGSSDADRVAAHRSELTERGDDQTREKVELIYTGIEELGNVCDPNFLQERSFDVRVVVAKSVATGIIVKISELLRDLPVKKD